MVLQEIKNRVAHLVSHYPDLHSCIWGARGWDDGRGDEDGGVTGHADLIITLSSHIAPTTLPSTTHSWSYICLSPFWESNIFVSYILCFLTLALLCHHLTQDNIIVQ
jgi:hypothetical protein